MGQSQDNQEVGAKTTPNGAWSEKRTNYTAQPVPLLLSKKYLCDRFGLLSAGGTRNYPALYRLVLTADVLQAAGLRVEDVRRQAVKTFDRQISCRLIHILGL